VNKINFKEQGYRSIWEVSARMKVKILESLRTFFWKRKENEMCENWTLFISSRKEENDKKMNCDKKKFELEKVVKKFRKIKEKK
jgi:hypothetical protein